MLAAGEGSRLSPLTRLLPKALCPVGGRPLVDHALERLAPIASSVAVNVHHGRAALESHLPARVHVSVETPVALGTAGALARLRGWIDGRPVLVHNVDSWHDADLAEFVAGWDGERTRLLAAPTERDADFGRRRYAGVALLPWAHVVALPEEPSGLYEVAWRDQATRGALEFVDHTGAFVDCGTPARYLEANLAASGGDVVVGDGAVVEGVASRAVLWPGTVVREREVLVDAVRASSRVTVFVR